MCGHGFCLSCIQNHMLNSESCADIDDGKLHECPVCREEFIDRFGGEDPLMRMYGIEESVVKFQEIIDEKNDKLESLNNETEYTKAKNEELVDEINALKRKLDTRDFEIWSLKRDMNTAEKLKVEAVNAVQRKLNTEVEAVNALKRKLNTAETLKELAYESLRVKRLRIKGMKDHATQFFETIVPERKKKKVVLKKKAKVMCNCGDHMVDPDEVDPWELEDEVKPDEVESGMDPDEVTSW